MEKRKAFALTTSILTGACLFLSDGARAETGNFLLNPPAYGYSNWSGCQVDYGTGSNRVSFDSNCNVLGANLNVSPFLGCTARIGSFTTHLLAYCNDATTQSQTKSGSGANDADISLPCFGGAYFAYYYVDSQ